MILKSRRSSSAPSVSPDQSEHQLIHRFQFTLKLRAGGVYDQSIFERIPVSAGCQLDGAGRPSLEPEIPSVVDTEWSRANGETGADLSNIEATKSALQLPFHFAGFYHAFSFQTGPSRSNILILSEIAPSMVGSYVVVRSGNHNAFGVLHR